MAICPRCGDPALPDRLGRPRKWCSGRCRRAACEEAKRKSCPDCGEPMGTGTVWRDHEVCGACRRRIEARAHRARVEDVAEMYREGMSHREIAAELGYGPNSMPHEIIEARRLGLIGYRNKGWGKAA